MVHADKASSLADVQIRLILAKLILAFDFELDDPKWHVDDWLDCSTRAYKTPLMLRARKATPFA